MNCGARNVRNGNFLGFYNELSGVLRVFVYVPTSTETNGNTHMWGVQLNDLLASRSVFHYGVPLSTSITTAKAKKCLNQTDNMSQVISPWRRGKYDETFSSNPLSPGWWAFDVDLSLYRDKEVEKTFKSLD